MVVMVVLVASEAAVDVDAEDAAATVVMADMEPLEVVVAAEDAVVAEDADAVAAEVAAAAVVYFKNPGHFVVYFMIYMLLFFL